jgi:4-alpha-glucanotransferase
MKQEGYSWWVARVKHALKVFNILRIDHFRGFAGYFSIPYGAPNAKGGHWEDGPRYALFEKIKQECPNANIVAENLGLLTPDVEELLAQCGFPGMNIFQFEWGDWNWRVPIYKGYPTNNVFYSGTHDNQMVTSFYESLEEWQKQKVNALVGINWGDWPARKIIEWCMRTACDTCIIPLQDYLGLTDEEGRMNIPSKASGNWQYMAKPEDFSEDLLNYIKWITKDSNR